MISLSTIWQEKNIPINLKLHIVKSHILPMVMNVKLGPWNDKTWTACEIWFYHRLLRITWIEKRTNDIVPSKFGIAYKCSYFKKWEETEKCGANKVAEMPSQHCPIPSQNVLLKKKCCPSSKVKKSQTVMCIVLVLSFFTIVVSKVEVNTCLKRIDVLVEWAIRLEEKEKIRFLELDIESYPFLYDVYEGIFEGCSSSCRRNGPFEFEI